MNADEAVSAPNSVNYALNVLWLERNIGMAVDQVFGEVSTHLQPLVCGHQPPMVGPAGAAPLASGGLTAGPCRVRQLPVAANKLSIAGMLQQCFDASGLLPAPGL